MKTVLVVDDEKNIRETLKDVLEDEGFEVILSENGKSALEILGRNAVDVVLLDLWLPEVGGMDVLRITKEEFTDIQVIIISGHGSIDTAVKATKMGAFDFIEKPLSIERVLNVVDHAIKIIGLRKENVELKEKSGKAHFMVEGRSRAFREIERIMESTAAGISRNLITGENGTGRSSWRGESTRRARGAPAPSWRLTAPPFRKPSSSRSSSDTRRGLSQER